MDLAALNAMATAMVAPGKGILAADESTGTIKKRFDAIGVENTETNRRDYRELLFRSDAAMKNHISGVILFEETLYQDGADGTPLVELIKANGSIPGIKVDKGAKPMDAFPGETGIIHVPHDEDIIRTPGMPYFKLKYLRSFVNVYHTPHMAFFIHRDEITQLLEIHK